MLRDELQGRHRPIVRRQRGDDPQRDVGGLDIDSHGPFFGSLIVNGAETLGRPSPSDDLPGDRGAAWPTAVNYDSRSASTIPTARATSPSPPADQKLPNSSLRTS